MMHILDYTSQGRRPTPQQIVADWKKMDRPALFQVEYGETYAEFTQYSGNWFAQGNGCEGFKRDKVVALLNADREPQRGRML